MMKKLLLLALTALSTSVVFAQDTYEQRVYVFQTTVPEQHEGLVERCKQVIASTNISGINMDGEHSAAYMSSLYRIETKKKTGLLKEKKKYKKPIGEMLSCIDWETYLWGGLENFEPAFFEVNIDGMTLYAQGGGTTPLFEGRLPGGGQLMTPFENPIYYPAPNVFVANFSATILPSIPRNVLEELGVQSNNPGFGGSMTVNIIYDAADPEGMDDQFAEHSVGVIRLFTPVEN
jgi:hypothetical protein